uniref:Plasmid stabilization system protein ParE n=1 Tax=Candidatus Kentrum sp. TUN TaxID=2126343 RepID=A0A450ZV06_9GAMM|nr:MAG: Plasmid stabilization system protein ParE [Candidatus Kentron sp. TUN]
MTKVIISKKAEEDLAEIIRYISIDNKSRAEAYIKELLEESKITISTFPFSSPVYNKSLDIRRFVYQKYNIYYQYDEKSNIAIILRVINSALLENMMIGD